MAEFKIEAGGKLELLTKQELSDTLKAWGVEITRGARFVQFSTSTTSAGAGTWQIGGSALNTKDTLGPKAGMIWAVIRLAISGSAFAPTTDDSALFTDEITASKLVDRREGNAANSGVYLFNVPQWILNGGERVAANGANANAGDIIISGQAVELPEQLAWMLL